MFCKYCGKPIDEGSMRCRICGRPVGQLEGGNGFWDLKEARPSEPADRSQENEPVPVPVKAAAPGAPEEIPTVAAASPADAKAIRELRTQVKKLQDEVKLLGPQKRNSLAGCAILLALLALALGAFVLFELRSFMGQIRTLTEKTTELGQIAEEYRQERAANEQKSAEEALNVEAQSGWLGFDELSGVRLFSSQSLFTGPNKGENDPRGQSIKLGLPENGYEETPIFTSVFNGPAGTYQYYWVKVETSDTNMQTWFTPLKEEDGYKFRSPLATDAEKKFVLSIMGEVKEEQLGRYAFVAVDTQTHSAYVSSIVELYDRAEQQLAVPARGNGGSGWGG